MIEQQDVHPQADQEYEMQAFTIVPNEILIVDDEMDFRLDLAELMFTQGFRVITAKNGREALDYIKHSKKLPELITLDVKMPEIDGLDFLKEIRQINNQIPIIFISGFVRNQEIDPYTRCLEKPLDRLELFNVIEQMRLKLK